MNRPTTINDLVQAFLTLLETLTKTAEAKPRTVEYYRLQLSKFVAHVGPSRAIDTIIPFDLECSGRSWHYLQAVKRLFAWAFDMELIGKNPFRRIRLPRKGGRKRVLTRTELVRSLRHCRPTLRSLLLAQWLCLARPQEIRQMHWRDYRPDVRCVLLADYKGKSRRNDAPAHRVLPVCARLARLLDRLRRRAEDLRGHVFLNAHGRPWSANALRLAMRRLRRRAGLVTVGAEPVVAYTLRHTAATEATALGIGDRTLADMMGHSSTRTTARYQHLQTEHLVNAIDRLRGRRTA